MGFYRRTILYTIAAVFILLLYFFVDARKGGLPPCPFYWITGFLCPGCGSQRALSALLHGHVLAAAGYNVLLVMSVPLLLYVAWVFFTTKGRGKPRLLYTAWFPKSVFVLVLLFWILRNIPRFPFTVLAP